MMVPDVGLFVGAVAGFCPGRHIAVQAPSSLLWLHIVFGALHSATACGTHPSTPLPL